MIDGTQFVLIDQPATPIKPVDVKLKLYYACIDLKKILKDFENSYI